MTVGGEDSAANREEGSMEESVRLLEAHGFVHEFAVVGPGMLRCLTCHRDSPAENVELREHQRVDVSTDPGDQAIVAGLVCPLCMAKGTHVFSYGAAASAEDKRTFAALRNDHATAAAP